MSGGAWPDGALDDLWLAVEPELPPGTAASRAKARENVAVVVGYGEGQAGAEWGGVYLNWEGPVAAVACFTGGLPGHEAALRQAVPHPDLLLVRQVGHNEAEMALALEQVEALLRPAPSPWTAAVRWGEDGFVVRVRLLREQAELAVGLERRFGELVRVERCL